jgi:hypothetical protein
MDLFGPGKLPYRLAVISDGDRQTAVDDTGDEPEELSARASKLAGRATEGVRIHLAERTLEWDLAYAGNTELLFAALFRVKPKAGICSPFYRVRLRHRPPLDRSRWSGRAALIDR